MLNIAICDDNINDINIVKTALKIALDAHNANYNLLIFNDSDELKVSIKNSKIDILFLDIEMPKINGFEIANEFSMCIDYIIFVSCRDDLVFDAFKSQPFRFIRKSHLDEINEAVSAILKNINSNKKVIYIKDLYLGNISILVKDINYIESSKDLIIIYCDNNKYIVRERMKNIINDLGSNFLRIHKGFIINIKKIHIIKQGYVEIKNNDKIVKIPIKRNFTSVVREKFVEVMKK